MNEDTINLLKECTSGCKMAIGSMRQVEGYLEDHSRLKEIITRYKDDHEELERSAARMLVSAGKNEKEPTNMASVCSWFKTEMKMMMKNDEHQVAKLMMDGCNMGIQALTEHRNQYQNAENEAQDIAGKIVKLEEQLVGDMKGFL